MCLSPNLIPNPNYGRKDRYSFLKDTKSKYIPVPCGICAECVKAKQLSLIQRVSMECLTQYAFFCTLTYNNESLPYIQCPDYRFIRYASFPDVVNMIKRLRKDNAFGRPFRYLAVSELGSKRARPHFHLIWFLPKYESDSIYTPYNLEKILFSTVLKYWSRNYGSKRKPVYKPLCTYVCKVVAGKLKSTYDLHYIAPSTLNGTTSDVSYYVTKYMMKPSEKAQKLQQALHLNLSLEDYQSIWPVVKPRWVSSLNFGFGVSVQSRNLSYQDRLSLLSQQKQFKYIKDNISRSRHSSDYPCFFDPENGKSFMLSRYWKKFGNLFTVDDALHFFYTSPTQLPDNMSIDKRSQSQKELIQYKHDKCSSLVDNNQSNFEYLFE